MGEELSELENKLAAARSKKEKQEASKDQKLEENENMGLGLRAGAELISTIFVGSGIGWLIDNHFETKPLFLITMLLLGIITGFMNVWRITQNIAPNNIDSPLHHGKKHAKTPPDLNR